MGAFENLGSYVYDSMRARVRPIVFERHRRSDFFVEKLYGMRARALASACLPARARGCPRRIGCSRTLGGSAAKWTNVVWTIKSRPTNQRTNKHTLLFYRYRRADKVGSDQRSSTIQYDSKSKHSKKRQTVNLGSGMLVFFSLFLKISSVTYTTACARVRFCF